ncbi:hypothetical protein [Sinomonas sp. G460-2]|uniref:hypothetical protein n=1 Tax=Sinomonas sp. G460-2 TaxID=3393464 RepID=UPI0039F09143
MSNGQDTRTQTGTALRDARAARKWSQVKAAHEYARAAARLDIAPPEPDTLRITISRWENGHQRPDEVSRRVLRHLYGLSDADLGAPAPAPLAGAAAELAARLSSSARVDDGLVSLFAQNTHILRIRDRQFGAAALLDQMSGHVEEIRTYLDHSLNPDVRAGLARVLADAGALAGWQALDAGDPKRAWALYVLARQAALEAGDRVLLAHALGEQAYVLLEARRAGDARQLIGHAVALGPHPPLLEAWLAAAEGEFAAAEGDRRSVLDAFNRAWIALPSDVPDGSMPFLTLDDVHLSRWRGSALARLGDPEAITDLIAALEAIDGGPFVRAQASLHTDLATAYAAAGERDSARAHLRAARQLAAEVGSRRLLSRLSRVLLPGEGGDGVQ